MAVSAFAAATPLPMNSELVFLGLLATGTVPLWSLVLIASIANTAGSFLTYGIGRGIGGVGRGGFAPEGGQRAQAEPWFARWGVWSLLLAWAPGGDLVVAMAGVLRTNLWLFGALVGFSKTLRYVVLAGGVLLFWGGARGDAGASGGDIFTKRIGGAVRGWKYGPSGF